MLGYKHCFQRLASSLYLTEPVGNCYNVLKTMERSVVMCDVKKYEKLYQEIEKLQPEDTLQLVLEAETEDQKEFYEMVGDFLLQKKQKEVIERKLF